MNVNVATDCDKTVLARKTRDFTENILRTSLKTQQHFETQTEICDDTDDVISVYEDLLKTVPTKRMKDYTGNISRISLKTWQQSKNTKTHDDTDDDNDGDYGDSLPLNEPCKVIPEKGNGENEESDAYCDRTTMQLTPNECANDLNIALSQSSFISSV